MIFKVKTLTEDLKKDHWEITDKLLSAIRALSDEELYDDSIISFEFEIKNLTVEQQCFGLKLPKNPII